MRIREYTAMNNNDIYLQKMRIWFKVNGRELHAM